MTAIQSDRAAGVLLGTAVGDALGAGYEFSYPRADQKIDMIGGGPFGFEPGEWTDDTTMAIGVALVTAEGFHLRTAEGLDKVAANWSAWYASGPKDIGNQTSAVLSRRDATAEAMASTARILTGLKGGNGSLMRTAPVALAYLDDAKGCAEAALKVSALTHDDQRAGEACQIWCAGIRHAVLHGSFDGVRNYLRATSGEVQDFWGPLFDQAESGSPRDFSKNGWVVHAIQTAWWAIHQTPADDATHLQAALEAAVRAGGDTDTTAAIAGGLLGARWGASAIPARWRRVLHGWPGLDAKALVTLGVRSATRGRSDSSGWPTVPRMDYSSGETGNLTTHPHDCGVTVAGADAPYQGHYDAVVSLCRMGAEQLDAEHIEFWLVDKGPADNLNLEFVLDDAARTVQALRAEGKTVLLHCVEGASRTPSVAARYSMLLGEDPQEVRAAMPWARPNRELWTAAVKGGISQ
ncbi:ADP-ribosylglycohydrolase [Nakamurella sp. UYEF19]|uniref:ADP-ribosylglycohydrolase family protein n=1 Tax=Nakamurella sp. UYEF19 TaxID=1756392 RepID=UPI00339AC2F7